MMTLKLREESNLSKSHNGDRTGTQAQGGRIVSKPLILITKAFAVFRMVGIL